jgi:hypothetical protein
LEEVWTQFFAQTLDSIQAALLLQERDAALQLIASLTLTASPMSSSNSMYNKLRVEQPADA